MRRLPLIIILLALCGPVWGGDRSDLSPRITITAEYRQDTIDYNDVEKRFIRDSACLTFGKSSVSFSHVNVGMSKENRFTWSICLRGLSPYAEFIIGNYYANFGAGLLVGRKTAVSSDPFARSLVLSRGNSFMPCSSGNPYFSFQGIVAGAMFTADNIAISLHGYYSFRNRFVRNDRMLPDITGTSLNSILLRTKKDYRYSDPVEINDCGYSLTMRIASVFTLQSYFIYTFIKRSNNHPLLWNVDTRGVPGGEKNFYGYGFYLQYRDDYILIFVDFCFPNRVLSMAGGRSGTFRGFGIICGMTFRHRACSLSISVKQTDRNFYSPYSSGSSTPETACIAAATARIHDNFSMGASFFTEKKRMPSGNEQYLRFSRREQVFFKYDARLKGSCAVSFAFVEAENKKGKEQLLRLSSASKIFIKKSMLFTINGRIQWKGRSRYSGSLGAGTRLALFNCVTLHIRYTRFFISPGSTVYTSASRQADSINRRMAVTSSSDLMAGGIRARFYGCTFSVDYLHQFARRRSLQGRVDASMTCNF